jgi:GPH family glycoside/pentoside/hexuronide:cation symporter
LSIEKYDIDEAWGKVTLKSKIGYSCTSLGTQLVHGIFLVSLLFYYREIILLPEIYLIWAFIFYAVWNAINDPLFGWLSDKTRTRWGRRIPYYFLFVPIMSVAFVFLWLSPTVAEVGETAVFIWLLIWMCIYDTAFTAALLVWSALGQEMSMNHAERGSIQIFSLIFGLVGFLIALLMPMLFLEEAGRNGFIFLSFFLAALQFILMMVTTITVKEKLEFSQIDEPVGLFDSIKYTFKSKSFWITVSMNFLLIFNQSVFFTNLFFFTYYGIPGYDPFFILLLIVGITLIGIFIGIIYISKINEKKGVKTAMIHSIFWQGVGFLLVGLVPGIWCVIGFFFFGISVFGALTLFNAAFGEVCDEDELKTGTRREAAIFGTNALITKPAESLAAVFIALMLLLFLYQEPISGVQQTQSDFTVLGIRIAMGIVPAIVAFLALLIFSFSPLHGENLKEIKENLNAKHEEKKQKLKAKISKK